MARRSAREIIRETSIGPDHPLDDFFRQQSRWDNAAAARGERPDGTRTNPRAEAAQRQQVAQARAVARARSRPIEGVPVGEDMTEPHIPNVGPAFDTRPDGGWGAAARIATTVGVAAVGIGLGYAAARYGFLGRGAQRFATSYGNAIAGRAKSTAQGLGAAVGLGWNGNRVAGGGTAPSKNGPARSNFTRADGTTSGVQLTQRQQEAYMARRRSQ